MPSALGSWRLRSVGEHCHLQLAVEVRTEDYVADIKSNNPHLGKVLALKFPKQTISKSK